MTDHTVPILKKAIAVFRAISAGGETNTKALALRAGVPHTSAYRILRTFRAEGWVHSGDQGRHLLSPELLPLLRPLLANSPPARRSSATASRRPPAPRARSR